MGKASNRKKNKIELWEPFVPGHLPPIDPEQIRQQAESLGIPFEVSMRVHEDIYKNEKIFINNLYQVNVRKQKPIQEGWPDMIHLSIKRRDKDPIHDWRHLQRIKNELLGPEYEAIELYPKESRLVDSANQYHLWVFYDESFKLNVGFDEGRFVRENPGGNAVQRPFA